VLLLEETGVPIDMVQVFLRRKVGSCFYFVYVAIPFTKVIIFTTPTPVSVGITIDRFEMFCTHCRYTTKDAFVRDTDTNKNEIIWLEIISPLSL
jgi:hypothetical protein